MLKSYVFYERNGRLYFKKLQIILKSFCNQKCFLRDPIMCSVGRNVNNGEEEYPMSKYVLYKISADQFQRTKINRESKWWPPYWPTGRLTDNQKNEKFNGQFK